MRGVIFDFNGTMVFDEKFHSFAWKKFIEEKAGVKISDEDYQKYCQAVNAKVTIERFLQKKFDDKELAELIEEKEKIYRKVALDSGEFKLVDGLENFLDALKKNNVPRTIATAAGLNNVKFFFEHFKLANWFDREYIVYDDGTLPGKPEPDMYLKAAEVIGMEISDCVIFEDSSSGIKAAKRSGAYKIIGITSTYDEENLLERGVSKAISDYTDLNSLLEIIL